MKPIKIDVDAVPEDKRTHPDYLGLLNDMTLGMADPAKVFSVCIHEAGHLFFGLEMRMEILGMDGPRIVYIDPDRFKGYGAKINIKIIKNTVEQAAIMLSAGGVVSEELNGRLGPGDSEDREIFNVACQNAGVTDLALIDSLWKAGQDAIRTRLQDPTFRDMMQELARRLMRDLEGAS